MKRLLPVVLGAAFLMTSSVGFSFKIPGIGGIPGFGGGSINCKGISGKSCHKGMPGCSCKKLEPVQNTKVGAKCKTATGKTCSSGTQGCVCVE